MWGLQIYSNQIKSEQFFLLLNLEPLMLIFSAIYITAEDI